MKAIILAGGQSERFGEPKAFAQINAQPFYKRIIDVLEGTNCLLYTSPSPRD